MPSLTVDELKKLLRAESVEAVVQKLVFSGDAFVFDGFTGAYERVRKYLESRIRVPEQNICIVGSGKVGLSLGPATFPRTFSASSDIDIVAVDSALYDKIWQIVLNWHYPQRIGGLGAMDQGWVDGRKSDFYWGYLRPDKLGHNALWSPKALSPLRDIRMAWFNAFKSLSNSEKALAGRNISGRLYRTWDHAMLYQADGMRQIKEFLKIK